MKYLIILILFLSFSNSCEIHTSQPNYNTMTLANQDGWYYNVIKKYDKRKLKSFKSAFEDNDREVKAYIQNVICEKLNWNGVVNYNLKWQITNGEYIFTVSFDAFKYK